MYATVIGEDKKLHWEPVEDPVIKENEVLLEVHAAALNRADLLQRAGQYPLLRDGRTDSVWKRPE